MGEWDACDGWARWWLCEDGIDGSDGRKAWGGVGCIGWGGVEMVGRMMGWGGMAGVGVGMRLVGCEDALGSDG